MGDHKKGVISVATSFLGRYREFDFCLHEMERPEGTVVDMPMGVNIARSFNHAARRMLEGDFEWVLYLGDDHTFPPFMLNKLLDRDVPVVVPLSVTRTYPFKPIIKKGFKDKFEALDFDWLKNKSGLVDISGLAIGNAGMLVRREVFEKIPAPWFQVGKFHPEINAPDLFFCAALNICKIPIHLDLDIPMGHMTHVAAYPKRNEDGTWEHQVLYPSSE